MSLEDGSGTVESVAVMVDLEPMYNLTVDEAHKFFVGDGEWLVHNTNSWCIGDPIDALDSKGNYTKDIENETISISSTRSA